jgi:hypothetical protein
MGGGGGGCGACAASPIPVADIARHAHETHVPIEDVPHACVSCVEAFFFFRLSCTTRVSRILCPKRSLFLFLSWALATRIAHVQQFFFLLLPRMFLFFFRLVHIFFFRCIVSSNMCNSKTVAYSNTVPRTLILFTPSWYL